MDRAFCAVWTFVQRPSAEGAKACAGALVSFKAFVAADGRSATAEQGA
jgi:hypothetical protein